MKSVMFGLALLAAALPLAPAQAADSAPLPPRSTPLPKVVIPPVIEEITVTGSRLGRVVRDFIEMATMPSPIGQVSRWKTPICPRTTGMRPAFTDFVSKRLREIAHGIGAPVNDNESCSPNLQVIFTEHPQAMLDTIRTKLPELLGYHYAPQTKELATVVNPIQGWYATGSRDRNNQLMYDDPYAVNTATVEGSRIRTGLRSEFVAVTVVVDLAAAENQEIGAITDHVAMLAFSQAKAFERCREVPSITNMLLDCAPDLKAVALTSYDRAYLKALYAINDRDTPRHLLNGDIAFMMRKLLAAENN
ncbi:MAG: hypothetical protein K1X51_12550 [Rhodospirillaceae bacterium]|nr:hypothetical protein [Rhodospirillaceae bacterium]